MVTEVVILEYIDGEWNDTNITPRIDEESFYDSEAIKELKSIRDFKLFMATHRTNFPKRLRMDDIDLEAELIVVDDLDELEEVKATAAEDQIIVYLEE